MAAERTKRVCATCGGGHHKTAGANHHQGEDCIEAEGKRCV
jgi:hypothetical protein